MTAANAAYRVTYDVSKGEMNAEFVITLTAENTGAGGVYAEGLNIATANNNVIVNIEEGVAKINVNVTPNGANTVTLNIAQNVAVDTVNFGDGSNGVNAIVAVINVGANSSVDAISMAIFKGVNLSLADGAHVGNYTTVDDHHEIIEVSGEASIGTITINGSNGSTTVQGTGCLTVENFVDQGKGSFNVLADMVFTNPLMVRNFNIGNEAGTVTPEVYVHINAEANGIGGVSGGSMQVRVLSGTLTVHNDMNAYSGVNFGAPGDRMYIAEGATVNVVNFGAAYGVWGSPQYYLQVEGTFNAYGCGAPNAATEATSPDQPGTYIGENGAYNGELALEDWQGAE